MRGTVSFYLFLSFAVALTACGEGGRQPDQLDLQSGWRFQTGDDLAYARADFDDSGWGEIAVDQTWNRQGLPEYAGFAWYRIKVMIPSSLKANAVLADSLVLNLGRIDDFDQVFLNGRLIGENLNNIRQPTEPTTAFKDLNYSFWHLNRRYTLPSNDSTINWDGENMIAVRVYDWGGLGGIYSGDLNIRIPRESDYLTVDIRSGEFESEGDRFKKRIKLGNSSSGYDIDGECEIRVVNNITEEVVFRQKTPLRISPAQEREVSFSIDKPRESTTIHYQFAVDAASDARLLSEGVPYILTPSPGEKPRINGALIYGQRAKRPFLYRIAATGERPLAFAAAGLPAGLELNTESGIITGSVETAGSYEVKLTAANRHGSDQKTLEIVIGDQLALTPPLGWNSWNCWGLSITQEQVYAAARSFIDLGLADHGWTFVNIDDGWEIKGDSEAPQRTPGGEILTNEKFPDMRKLGEQIHALGLKLGIYSSPGDLTCGGYTGSYQHEQQDARTFAEWGVDYLKYDLCSYRNLMTDQNAVEELLPPYQLMQEALSRIDRDIVYSICEYGNGRVWEWGESVGGNLWRTTGDIWDDWDRLYQIGFGQVEAAEYAGPGHWNDPDMLVLGWIGWGPDLHQTLLTPDEQYTHVSLWALLSAPLLLGNDLTRMDDFTLNLITNDEVLAIDQDRLGRQAIPVIRTENIEVWRKELADGSIAFGIFNIGDNRREYNLDLSLLGIEAEVTLRDVWRQQDVGRYRKSFGMTLPAHGVVLMRTVGE